MTKRLTKREKRDRAKARRWVRQQVAEVEARVARLRAEEPELAALDQAMADSAAARRRAKRLVGENAVTAVFLLGSDGPCGRPDCKHLTCRAAEIAAAFDEAVGRASEASQAPGLHAAEERVRQRLRAERNSTDGGTTT